MILRTIVLATSALFTAAAAACAQGAAPSAGRATQRAESFPAESLLRVVREQERATGGRIGFHLRHVESGRTVAHNAAEPFFMSSVTKLPISVVVLRQVERGRVRLDQVVDIPRSLMSIGHSPIRQAHPDGTRLPVRELLRFAVSLSDNTASDALLRLAGGADSVTAELRRAGFAGVRVSRPYTQLGCELGGRIPAGDDRDAITPETATALLAALQQGRVLGAPLRALLLGWMTRTENPAGRIVAGLPAGTAVAHKTGTWGNDDHPGPAALNDVGIITLPGGAGHLAIAVMVRNAAVADTAVERAVAAITRETWRLWTAGRTATTAPAGGITPERFARLRWIEGTWRGSGPGQALFYERYAFADDSTLRVDGFSDSTLATVSEVTWFELRGGTLANRGERVRWAAGALDDTSVTFVPVAGARNRFTWRRTGTDGWTAELVWPEAPGAPARRRVYEMRRWQAGRPQGGG